MAEWVQIMLHSNKGIGTAGMHAAKSHGRPRRRGCGHILRSTQIGHRRPGVRHIRHFFFRHLKECVRQREVVDLLHAGVGGELGVQVEEHRHVYLLPRPQLLLLKAEALYLVEVRAGLLGRDVVGGNTSDDLVAHILSRVERQSALARSHLNTALGWQKFPGHAVITVGIEGHGQFACSSSRLCGRVRLLSSRPELSLHCRALSHSAAVPRCLAEHAVERNGSIGDAYHGHREGNQIQGLLIGIIAPSCPPQPLMPLLLHSGSQQSSDWLAQRRRSLHKRLCHGP
mmetsp:Transcript_1784/g.5195  ORF Transcript_1784/g.5195 Transcript_1784/m.5195 type:complete len:285 (-) Transcript_1784:426-1280(-)